MLAFLPAVAGAAPMGSFLARYSELRTERVDVEGGSAYVLRDIARGETLDLAEIAIDARTIEAGAAARGAR